MSVKVRAESNYYTTNDDLKFVMETMVDWKKVLEVMEEGDLDTYKMILETAGKLTGSKFAQRLSDNDKKGSHFNTSSGKIDWAEGFEKTFEEIKEAGLLCLPIHAQGGPGFPLTISMAVTEMVSRADASCMTKYGLIEGVAEMIERFADEKLKTEYLPKLISGEFTASMDLTEAEAGSDLGGVTTRVTEKDGKYYIEGSKVFITTCDADVHLVLVREGETFKETKGTTKGLSIYLVPQILDGRTNNVSVTKTEEKLGIKASATGGVNYDNAQGFLVGKKGDGMRQMLRLMYGARLGVSAQALGIAEAAYQEAKDYAYVRKQFGSEIVNQPLVLDMLAEMKVHIEAMRALTYETSWAIDLSRGYEKKALSGDAAAKGEYDKYNSKSRVLTPLVKYYTSEKCIEIARKAIQVHGGVGFTKEYLVEQFLRDSIITTIYEGTSEIQASMAVADILRGFFATEMQEVKKFLNSLTDDLAPYAEKIKKGSAKMEELIGKLQQEFFTAGDSYIRLRAKEMSEIVIYLYASYLLLQQAQKSSRKKYVAKLYIDKVMPKIEANVAYIEGMDKSVLQNKDLLFEGRN
ncbi:MAG: 3-methylmercaptopropionyl-CoA dehydrogenase [Syntrophomonadaceae bacterium]|nr:3-methylmercaptopropionyl-CoA dehydrogenase [Bacillota bacterium]